MAVLERLLRLAAIVCSLLVVAGWGWFALDETSAASKSTQQEIAGREATRAPDPDPEQESARENAHGAVREAIDDANDVLLRPFAPLVENNDNKWVRRSVPAFLALVLYGFGLGLLARFAAGRS
jgi:hypothetical protein